MASKTNMKRIAKSAANYRNDGLSARQAMKKAWDDERKRSGNTGTAGRSDKSSKPKSIFERIFG